MFKGKYVFSQITDHLPLHFTVASYPRIWLDPWFEATLNVDTVLQIRTTKPPK